MNASLIQETIVVTSVNKFGVKVWDKQYNFSKFLKDREFTEGLEYNVEVFVSDTGAKYINAKATTDPNVKPGDNKGLITTATSLPIKFIPINKDKRILVQGILQAVLQSQGLLMELTGNYTDKVKNVTLDLVNFVEEQTK